MKITTTFQLPVSLKIAVAEASKNHNVSVSQLVQDGIMLVLKSHKEGVPKLKRNSETLVYTSILIPEDIRDKAKIFATKHNVSFGDVIRCGLDQILEKL